MPPQPWLSMAVRSLDFNQPAIPVGRSCWHSSTSRRETARSLVQVHVNVKAPRVIWRSSLDEA